MGASMASNLLKNFKHVTVYDINPDSVNALVAKGAKSAKTIKEIALNCDAIVTMLPATKHVSEVLLSADGIFANAKPGTIVIDSSTIDPQSSKSFNEKAIAKGIKMLDAPVSGGVTGAAAGTLTFMIGGAQADLDLSESVFKAMGKNIVYCGGPGSGEVAKLCNNLSLAISMIGTSEALSLGKKGGSAPTLQTSRAIYPAPADDTVLQVRQTISRDVAY